MKSLLRPVGLFLVGVLLAIGLLLWIQPEEPEAIAWHSFNNVQMEEKVKTASDAVVRDYISWNDRREWKQLDIVPGYVANAGDYKRAEAAVIARHPRFGKVTEPELLDSIRIDPLGYRAYRFDLLATSRFYLNR